jgi:DNA-binding NarL/FixJ family response regulator
MTLDADNQPPRKPRVLIADDHLVVAEGIARLIEPRYETVAIVTKARLLPDSVRSHDPDLILCDISMPELNGIAVVQQMRAEGIATPIMFLTMHGEPGIVDQALKVGANGYVLKTAPTDELLRALQEVLRGSFYVTPTLLGHVLGRTHVPRLSGRQQQVLEHLAAGLRSKEIAHRLDLSVRTVEAHRQILMQILSVRNSIELVHRAEELGLVQRDRS